MKNQGVISLLVISLISCTSSRQGKVTQGKDGKIENAKIISKCTPPQKSYAKGLQIKLKAEMDSLKYVPQAYFETSFEQKIIKLHDYTPIGLDLDLLTFRICEMANNRGLTSEQTGALIEKAIQVWHSTNTITFQQNITSNNQSGGITAGVVNLETPKRILTLNEKTLLNSLQNMDFKKINITCSLGDAESFQFAQQIKDYMENKFPTKDIDGVNQAVWSHPVMGTIIDTSQVSTNSLIRIIIGTKK